MFGKAGRLRAVLKSSRIRTLEAIYIGDELRDAEAARKAGMAFGAVGWGHNSLEALRAAGADEYFTSPREIGEKLA
jgi:phosphoglycolate phosphatase